MGERFIFSSASRGEAQCLLREDSRLSVPAHTTWPRYAIICWFSHLLVNLIISYLFCVYNGVFLGCDYYDILIIILIWLWLLWFFLLVIIMVIFCLVIIIACHGAFLYLWLSWPYHSILCFVCDYCGCDVFFFGCDHCYVLVFLLWLCPCPSIFILIMPILWYFFLVIIAMSWYFCCGLWPYHYIYIYWDCSEI